MRKDVDDSDDNEEISSDTDSEDDGAQKKIDLESEYHQLKEAIAQLVQEYEIPKELAPESESKGFSNRTSTVRREARQRARGGSLTGQSRASLASKNPYQSQGPTTSDVEHHSATERKRSAQQSSSSSNPETKEAPRDKVSVLVTMLEAAMQQCQARDDFVSAHKYYKTLQQLRNITSQSLTKNGYASLLNYFSRGPRDSLGRMTSAIEEYEAWFVWLKQSQERQDATIEDMMMGVKTLRDKMWYRTDVRNSATYEEAKNVALALKLMGQPPKDGKPTHKPRTKSVASNFLLKTEAQTYDLMAASIDHAGPNKLADEQAEMTANWIKQYGIESSFCKGEERIHRFCLEIDKCVNKLVGEDVLDGPVLWSSELYRRDKEILDSGRQKGDLFMSGVGTLSAAGDEEYETRNQRGGLRSLDFVPRPSQSSLRSVAASNGSQQSFDSGRFSAGRPVDLLDSSDYFGSMGPVYAIDSAQTFWSPFHTQAHAPSGTGSIRPRTGTSSRGTVILNNSATANNEKRRFLLDLKQALTGLLLSDLGVTVFSQGSETDAWFCGDLGEECLQRKAEEDRRRKKALARKKSMKSMKARGEHRSNALDTMGRSERGSPAAPVATLQHASTEAQSAGEYSTSSSDATARSPGMSAAKKAGLLEFPYNVAFRRLLRRFATHPNPFSKLHALYELEQLIVASLSSKSGRSYSGRKETLPTVPQSPTLGSVPELSSRDPTIATSQAQNLEEAIVNVTERRSHSMNAESLTGRNSPFHPSSGTGTRSPNAGPPSTDMIVDVLQGLFRDAEIRPKTLFRDLQYIASFVPASMLDKTARGKAFWDASLAALNLKQDVCRVMVEIADDIVALNTESRSVSKHQQAATAAAAAAAASTASSNNTTGTTSATATAKQTSTTTANASDVPAAVLPLPESSSPNPTAAAAATTTAANPAPPPPDPLSKFTMSDAARLLIITAKEGDAVAERELAIFYLTHPDLLPRTLLPLTKPGDVFKGELALKEGGERGDPWTMCVAQHWMEWSRRGGDGLAGKYLRQRDEMERIP